MSSRTCTNITVIVFSIHATSNINNRLKAAAAAAAAAAANTNTTSHTNSTASYYQTTMDTEVWQGPTYLSTWVFSRV